MPDKPTLSIPAPLRGEESGSFAEDTIKRRLPDIARRVSAENALSPAQTAALEQLIAGMPFALIRPLNDHHAPDSQLWQTAVTPYRGHNWLQAPWFFAETYFFRRIIEAVDYFRSGLDPFAHQKQQEGEIRQEAIIASAQRWALARAAGWQDTALRSLLLAALWGNQADLSLWDSTATDKPDHTGEEAWQTHLLVDNLTAVAAHLHSLQQARVDFVLDNAGLELVNDLALVDYLLACGKAAAVHLHVKRHPTFVSDVTLEDIKQTLTLLSAQEEEAARALGQRLAAGIADGRIHLPAPLFWTSPYPTWQMPGKLRADLAHAQLVISKGDANYRRALGDASWPFTTPFADVVSYFPAPVLFLRVCKSPVLAGLTPAQLAQMNKLEGNWVTSGRWGVIQFRESLPK